MKTTKQHYDKYEEMAQYLLSNGVSWDYNSIHFLIPYNQLGYGEDYNMVWLKKKFNKDNVLNNIPLRLFDHFYDLYRPRMTKKYPTYSLADNVCVLKHILIYWILKEKPEYT